MYRVHQEFALILLRPVIPELGQLCIQCGPLRRLQSPDGEQPFPFLFPHGVKCSLALCDVLCEQHGSPWQGAPNCQLKGLL